MQKIDTSLIIDVSTVGETWVVYEHQAVLSAGAPPEVILVGVCRLTDVFRLIEPRSNSEWTAIFANGGHVLVRIVAMTTARPEAVKFAGDHMRTFNPLPRCNLRGVNTKHNSRPIKCNETGVVYESQKDCAARTGIMQSALSRHLHGHLRHVRGNTYSYYNGA